MLRIPKGEGPEGRRLVTLFVAMGAAGAASVLALLGAYLPFFSWLFSALWPLPISLAALTGGSGCGVLALLGAAVLLGYFLGPAAGAVFFLPLGVGGWFVGSFLPRLPRPGVVWVFSMVLVVVLMAGTLLFLAPVGLFSFANLEGEMETYLRDMVSAYEAQGLPEPMLSEEYLQRWIAAFKRLLPAFLILETVAMVTVNFIATYFLARRWKITISVLPPFSEWQMPWYYVWGVILGLAAWLGGDFAGLPWLVAVGQNVLVVYLPFLLVFGTAVVAFYYQRSSLPSWLKAGLVILALFYIHVAVLLVVALGVFDPLLNYRKLARSGGVRE